MMAFVLYPLLNRRLACCCLLSLLLACLCAPGAALAQDAQFTQYFASPLNVNPANTGFFDGDYRLAVNERRQWWSVGDSYTTTSLQADIKLNQPDQYNNNVLALGLSGIFEHSLGGTLTSNWYSVSLAYHKSLDYEGRQTLALGLQGS